MDTETTNIYRAIAEMAYVIAKAEFGLSAEERIAFFNIAEEELEYGSWAATSRFELLDEVLEPELDVAYNKALHELKAMKGKFTPELKAKALRVLKRVAEACEGYGQQEAFIIDRFQKDIKSI